MARRGLTRHLVARFASDDGSKRDVAFTDARVALLRFLADVRVSSKPIDPAGRQIGDGSRTIPLFCIRVKALAPAYSSMSFDHPLPLRTMMRVLVVEDEPKLRESLAEGLQLEQFSVTVAASGAEARHHLAVVEYDAMVLDRMLPDSDGLELVRQLRSEGKQVPVLMITAQSRANGRELALKAGVNGFLPKPFSFDELLAETRALLAPRPIGDGERCGL